MTNKKKFIRKCKCCKKEFISMNSLKMFCSGVCKTKEFKKKTNYPHVCEWCSKDFYSKSKKTRFCSHVCSGHWRNGNSSLKTGNCKVCGIKFTKKNNRNLYCSKKCKEISFKNRHQVLIKCSYCRKKYNRYKNGIRKNSFCSKDCESRFRETEANDVRVCEQCGREFHCKKGDKLRFCGVSCRQHSIPNTMTKPHIIACKILEELNLSYEVEKPVGRYSLDCFLIDKRLGIEVMGTYWHTDVRFYDKISKTQRKNIGNDKRKNKYLLSMGIPVLYLWEHDLINSRGACKLLVHRFFRKNGFLENQNSMNYEMLGNRLILVKDKLQPYFSK